MAEKKPAKKSDQPKKKAGKMLSSLYTLSGSTMQRKNKFCPKCGPGMFMGNHKERVVCGKCGYTVFVSRKV